jgi:hypothetical protein
MRPAARAAAAAVVVALAGCPLHPRAPLPPTREGEWAAARDAATRRAVLYDGLKHRATATATHLTLPVREARARRLAEWLGWTPKELEDRLAQERADAAAGEEVVVSFFSADPRWNDLDAPRSSWRIALKVGETDVLARRTTGLEPSATTGGLFPYVGPFDVVYRVTFPQAPEGTLEGKPFVLEIASALGKLSLDFGVVPKAPTQEPWQPVPPP